eukprot:TRINITY_DN336_c0_g2_i1.p1 TRINITY_DN336_c0_g2~~TRINITY_DN336_c0_g2_i1.p1  ORF type:complete len:292 (+),score=36.88 TRINITY_DN336_c0_g2_i1:95-970(+)
MKASYEGDLDSDNKRHGFGKITWEDGESFEGEFNRDEKTFGTFRWKSGDLFRGQWKNDLMHGIGIYFYSDGREYKGEWRDGFRHGVGIFRWPNADYYLGQFDTDLCHGIGIHSYADGKTFKGQWKASEKQGYGLLCWPSGECTEGFWENNLLTGQTVSVEQGGVRYEEYWNAGARDGGRKILKRGLDDMMKLKRVYLMANPDEEGKAVDWVEDGAFLSCYKCEEAFTLLNRRHHCRCCGLLFCDSCSGKRLRLQYYKKIERVCDECFLFLRTQQINLEIEAICTKVNSISV